jgi:hypothetical protein
MQKTFKERATEDACREERERQLGAFRGTIVVSRPRSSEPRIGEELYRKARDARKESNRKTSMRGTVKERGDWMEAGCV